MATVYVQFDDMRDAERSLHLLASHFGRPVAGFITAREYYNKHFCHRNAYAFNEYEGQISVYASYTTFSASTFPGSLFDMIVAWSAEFGALRSIAKVRDIAESNKAVFRIEFFKVSAAERARSVLVM